MIVFPNAKINLGLHVLGKRSDGYHDIETVMLPIQLFDVLEAVPAAEGNPYQPTDGSRHIDDEQSKAGHGSNNIFDDAVSFAVSGLKVADDGKANICVRAYELMQLYARESGVQMPATCIHLHKNIAIGAGLGGGSADAAFTLQLLSTLYSIEISEVKLKEMAASLGSDCPFFIDNRPMLARGRGELVKEVHIPDVKNLTVVLAIPSIHISTAEAYRSIRPNPDKLSLEELIKEPPELWKNCLVNDFEPVIFSFHPTIKKIKETLYEQGAIYASMSGSGSSVYGLFDRQRGFDHENILQLKKICANLRIHQSRIV